MVDMTRLDENILDLMALDIATYHRRTPGAMLSSSSWVGSPELLLVPHPRR